MMEQDNWQEPDYKPLEWIRLLFQEVEPEDILYFDTQNPKVRYVRKKATLARIIEALREAVYDYDHGRICMDIKDEMQVVFSTIRISPEIRYRHKLKGNHLQDTDGKLFLPLSYPSGSPCSSYGPKFEAVLRSLTEEDTFEDE